MGPPLPHPQPWPLPGGRWPPEPSWRAGQARGRRDNPEGTDSAAHTVHLQVVVGAVEGAGVPEGPHGAHRNPPLPAWNGEW